jgi:hypothetical protein
MPSAWSLARVEEAKCYWFADHHVVRIRGELPTPCYDVNLDQSLLDVEPPGFVARWRARPEPCTKQTVPYDYREAFNVGGRREQVVVHHEGGELEVRVEDAPDGAAAAQAAPAAARDARIANAYDPLTGDELPLNEAVGYSTSWDFGQAFQAAVAALPVQEPGTPDWLSHYEVVAVGAEIGGIAGFNHLWVRARG